MRGRQAIGAIAILVAFAIAVWALLIRTPDGAKKAIEEGSRKQLVPTYTDAFGSSAGPDSNSAPNSSSADAQAETTTITASSIITTPITVLIADPFGDLTPSVLDPPPPWADLVGADLTLDATGYTLRVHLGGGQAPNNIDADHTMNIGSFFDLDGDGQIDEEVWANLVSGGWGGAWFNDHQGQAKFVDDSGVDVTVEGDAVVLRFGTDKVLKAKSFRWSIASEWGKYAVIGTVAAARDDDPDNDQPASFPG